jgi:ribosome-associated protein
MQPLEFTLRGEFIQLDQLLKAAGLSSSGGAAHAAIVAGQVEVDGQVEQRKRAKIRAGQSVRFEGREIVLRAGHTE